MFAACLPYGNVLKARESQERARAKCKTVLTKAAALES